MTLLFMPDISGFTQFVKNVEIKHSKHIISELIELIDKENEKKFQLAEIEGDALFYYQEEKNLTGNDILKTIQRMHDAFHAHLNLYRYKRICNCGACTSAADLNIKFILHIGETELIELNHQKKPFGAEVILLHRLLKNKVPSKEYVLFSKQIYRKFQLNIESLLENNIKSIVEDIDGEATEYFYSELKRKKINTSKKSSFPQLEGLDFIEKSIEFKKNPQEVFQYIIDLEKRKEWNEGLDDFIFNKNEINQIESMHTCVINGRNVDIKTVYSKAKENEFIYIEETESIPFLKCLITVIHIEKKGASSTVHSKAYLKPKNILSRLVIPLIKAKLSRGLVQALKLLKRNMLNN